MALMGLQLMMLIRQFGWQKLSLLRMALVLLPMQQEIQSLS